MQRDIQKGLSGLAALLVSVVCLALPLSAAFALQQEAVNINAVDSIVRKGLADHAIPGATIAIVRGGRVVYQKGFGVTSVETGAPVTVETLFRISSNTKVFTATALLMLAEEARVKVSESVGTYVTGLSPALARLTFQQLLSHTAGLSDDLSVSGPHDESALLEYVRSWKDDFVYMRPGLFSYSSPGFALVGAAIEEIGGASYANQMNDRLFKPLGMNMTTFQPTVAVTFPFAQGHSPSAGAAPKIVRPLPDNAARWPTGGMFSNVTDLSRFVLAYMNAGILDGRQVLPSSLIAQLARPNVDVPNRADGGKYGYGLYESRYRGLRVIWHDGVSSGFGSVIRMVPDQQFAVLALGNVTRASAGLLQISDRIFDHFLRPESPVTAAAAAAPNVSLPASELVALAGTYSNPYLGSVTLSVHDGTLYFKANAFDSRYFFLDGTELPLTQLDGKRFSMTPPALRTPFTLEILRRADGKPEFVHWGSRAFKRIADSR